MQSSGKGWRFRGCPVAWLVPSSSSCHQGSRHWARHQTPRHLGLDVINCLFGVGNSVPSPMVAQRGEGQKRGAGFVSGATSLSYRGGGLGACGRIPKGQDPTITVIFLSVIFIAGLQGFFFFLDPAALILGFSAMLSITLSARQDASVRAKCQQKVRKKISCNLKLITLPRS